MPEAPDDGAGTGVDISGLAIPPESVMLRSAYKKSGLTIADLASATGLSTGTVQIALSGVRYRDGRAKASAPPDHTLVKLASVLHIHPDLLRAHDRDRAAAVLAEVADPATLPSDLDAQAVAAGRQALAKQVLAVFGTEELSGEIERRQRSEHDALDREARDELAEGLLTEQWPG